MEYISYNEYYSNYINAYDNEYQKDNRDKAIFYIKSKELFLKQMIKDTNFFINYVLKFDNFEIEILDMINLGHCNVSIFDYIVLINIDNKDYKVSLKSIKKVLKEYNYSLSYKDKVDYLEEKINNAIEVCSEDEKTYLVINKEKVKKYENKL